MYIHINAAGLLSNHKCMETSLAEWHRVFRVNVDGALLLSQQVLPGMVRATVDCLLHKAGRGGEGEGGRGKRHKRSA